MEDKLKELLEGIDVRQLATLLGISYNGAKKKLARYTFTVKEFDILLKNKGFQGIMFRR